MRRRRTIGWWLARLLLAGWFALSLGVNRSDLEHSILPSGHAPSALATYFLALPSTIVATVVALMVVWLSVRHPIARRHIGASLLLHGGAAVLLMLCALLARAATRMALLDPGAALSPDRDLRSAAGLLQFYIVIGGIAHAVEYARRYGQKQAAELRLQVELGQAELHRTAAELRMLKMQLNPHFLFNSLNAVSLLVPTAPTAAQRMVVGLAELLRRAMHSVATQEVALEEELAGLQPFVEIEQLRLGGGLTVDWQVADETLDALVPHMVLQPLVENAIKHGIVPAGGRGRIRVRAAREGDWLALSVADDGAGLGAAAETANGIGSANVQARLTQLYGARHQFELKPDAERGTLAIIRIPWHEEPLTRSAFRPSSP
jgi:two-component system, LytTR family, sensor kinase